MLKCFIEFCSLTILCGIVCCGLETQKDGGDKDAGEEEEESDKSKSEVNDEEEDEGSGEM